MNLDLKKHRLLKILSEKNLPVSSGTMGTETPIGISYEDIQKSLNCDRITLELITSELYANKEIGYYDYFDIKGLYCEKNGLISYSKKNYKSRYWKNFWSKTLTISQVTVPLLSLVIALVAVIGSNQDRVSQKEIDQLKLEVQKLSSSQNFALDKNRSFLNDTINEQQK